MYHLMSCHPLLLYHSTHLARCVRRDARRVTSDVTPSLPLLTPASELAGGVLLPTSAAAAAAAAVDRCRPIPVLLPADRWTLALLSFEVSLAAAGTRAGGIMPGWELTSGGGGCNAAAVLWLTCSAGAADGVVLSTTWVVCGDAGVGKAEEGLPGAGCEPAAGKNCRNVVVRMVVVSVPEGWVLLVAGPLLLTRVSKWAVRLRAAGGLKSSTAAAS
jgi:hypothetical protein